MPTSAAVDSSTRALSAALTNVHAGKSLLSCSQSVFAEYTIGLAITDKCRLSKMLRGYNAGGDNDNAFGA
jgi:hypothetical protein